MRLTAPGVARAAAIRDARASVLSSALAVLAPAHRRDLAAAVDELLAAVTSSRWDADHLCLLCDEEACGGEACPVERAAVAAEEPEA